LSPLAREWIRKTKVEIEYSDSIVVAAATPQSPRPRRAVYWCDSSEHATAKAALMSFGDSLALEPITSSNDCVTAIRNLTNSILSHRADAGVLMLNSAGAATVHANRIPELRAIVGTTVDSVCAAMRAISPNVLILERGDQSFEQIRNICARFFRSGGVA